MRSPRCDSVNSPQRVSAPALLNTHKHSCNKVPQSCACSLYPALGVLFKSVHCRAHMVGSHAFSGAGFGDGGSGDTVVCGDMQGSGGRWGDEKAYLLYQNWAVYGPPISHVLVYMHNQPPAPQILMSESKPPVARTAPSGDITMAETTDSFGFGLTCAGILCLMPPCIHGSHMPTCPSS